MPTNSVDILILFYPLNMLLRIRKYTRTIGLMDGEIHIEDEISYNLTCKDSLGSLTFQVI